LIALGPAWLLAAPCQAVGAAGPQAMAWKINATVVIENMQMNWIWCGVPNLITYHHTLFIPTKQCLLFYVALSLGMDKCC
jgi:hypothetical protein